MKIALVLMPSWSDETPSLAIAYLASALKYANHKVKSFEFNLNIDNNKYLNFNRNESLFEKIINNKTISVERKTLKFIDNCIKKIKVYNPDIIGLSVYNCNKNLSLLLAKKINIPTIAGGPFIYDYTEKVKKAIKNSIFNFAIEGEAEKVLPEILSDLKKKDIKQKLGTKYFGIIKSNNIKDLNVLQFPEFRKDDINKSRVPWMLPIQSSRGCIGICSFCRERMMWKNYRQRTAINVIKEILYQHKKHNINSFRFNDSLINGNYRFINDFCGLISKLNLNIKWGGNIRIDKNLNKNTLSRMAYSGCKFLLFGAESGSDKVLGYMNKGITTKETENCINFAHMESIWVHVEIIVGFPGETIKDFYETVSFLKKNKNNIDSFNVNPFFTFPKLNSKIQFSDVVPQMDINHRINYIERMLPHKRYFPSEIMKNN